MQSDRNWCNFFFISLASVHFFGVFIAYFFKKYVPDTFVRVLRYGKLINTTQSEVLKVTECPKSYFKHFYLLAAFVYSPLVLYEILSVYLWKQKVSNWFMILLDVCCGSDRHVTVSATHINIAITLMILQILRRFYDTHFVSVFSKNAVMNLFQYSVGLLYYMCVFLIILSEAPKFTKTDGEVYVDTTITWTDLIAILIFFWAWYHQHTTTVILAKLRKNKKGDVVTDGYKIPTGDWFKYLSAPHCTAELLIYASIWVILGIKHSWWSVCTLVLTNQLDSIISTHQWYRRRFKDFPKDRKAFIPFII